MSLLVLLKAREFFVTVDNFSLWRRHLAWAMESGKDMRGYMTQRYASNMVFMSLLLSTELGVLFNSATVTSDVRLQLREGHHDTVSFWAGMMIIISALLTLLSLISTFTAWAMVNAVDEINAHCIFRSSIGQYAAELPGRLIICSIYSFLISFMMFFFLLLPFGLWSLLLLLCTSFIFIHIVSVFSAFGRIIMHTGAMGKSRIFTPEYEEFLVPHSLHQNLLTKARANLANNTSIIRQYRRKQKPINRTMTDDEMYHHLNDNYDHLNDNYDEEPSPNIPYRPRADSTVRFADQEFGYFPPPPPRSSNIRNLSQLSDISSRHESDVSLLTPSSAASSTRKAPLQSPLVAMPARSSLPPLLMTHGAPLRNVSTSSLEQWLQASPQGEESRKSSAPFAEPASSNNMSMPPPPPKQDTTRTSNNIGARPLTPKSSDTNADDRDLSEDERFSMGYALPTPLRTVSSTSVEQWLQASPQGGEETRKPNAPPPLGVLSSSTNRPSALTRPLTPKSSDTNADDGDLPEDERFAIGYPLPSPLRTVSSTTSVEQWLQDSPQGGEETCTPNDPPPLGELSSSTNRPSTLTLLPPRPKLVTRTKSGGGTRPPTAKTQDANFDDRDLSEDERFTMDYGDFDNEELPQNFAEDYEAVDGFGGGETTRLLDSGNRSNYYSSPSGDPFSSSRKKSPPPAK
jgi:hypothetical protein